MDKNGGIYANIRGLFPSTNKTKIPYLQDLALVSNAPFIVLTETHLNPNIVDAEIHLKNYTLYRSDRVGRSHGGVCTYVRNDLAAEIILKDSNSYCDTLVLKVHQLNLFLINVYRPPGCKSQLFIQTVESLRNLLKNTEQYSQSAPNILIFGDFNFPNIIWRQGSGYLNQQSDTRTLGEERKQAICLLEFAEEFFLDQLIKTPTRNRNILDLMFSNNHQLIHDYSVICNSRLSDHYIVKFCLNYEQNMTKTTSKKKSFYKTKLNEYDFFNASEELWLRFNLLMTQINFEDLFKDSSTDEMLKKFYDAVEATVDIVFDKKEDPATKNDFSSANKIPRNIRVLMRRKSNLSKSILNSKSGKKISNLKLSLQEVELQLENHYKKRRENQENDALTKIKSNPKFFYSYAKRFSKLKTTIGPFIDGNGEVVNDSFEMAEMLKTQYEKAFSVPSEDAVIDDPVDFFSEAEAEDSSDPSIPYIHITHQDVIEAIDDLSASASPGPDYFPAILLKKGNFHFVIL